jgi:hypothetical protein
MQSKGPSTSRAKGMNRALFARSWRPKNLQPIKKRSNECPCKGKGDKQAPGEGPKVMFSEVLH